MELRYYLYDDENIIRSHENNITSIPVLQALIYHPRRTLDPTEAHLFIVPLVFFKWKLMRRFQAFVKSPTFNSTSKDGVRHVLFGSGHVFEYGGKGPRSGIVKKFILEKGLLRKVIAVRDVDMNEIEQMSDEESSTNNDFHKLFNFVKPLTPYSISLGMGTLMEPYGLDAVPLIPSTVGNFVNRSWELFLSHTHRSICMWIHKISTRASQNVRREYYYETNQQQHDNDYYG